MGDPVSIVLVGIGGYGGNYVKQLLRENEAGTYRVVGGVDPNAEASPYFDHLQERNIPTYRTLQEFYEAHDADLAIISSPINFHCEQTEYALAKGSHVLCEKPISATVEEAERMMKARDESGKSVAIGFNWSFSGTIHRLKKDIASGVFGKPKRLKTMALWPRNKDYFARPWAAKRADSQGRFILDSVANNATSHYLHNMFYVLGEELDRSARPETVEAELYRANPVETFDTAAIRVQTTAGTELLYYSTHAVNRQIGPVFEYEFELATVSLADEGKEKNIIARFHDGREIVYGNPDHPPMNKIWVMLRALRDNGPIPCGLEAALSHTLTIDAIHRSVPESHAFATDIVRYDEERQITWVDGLYEAMETCYEQAIMPHESDAGWAKKGEKIEVTHDNGQ